MHVDHPGSLDCAPQLYDKKVSVILNHSLTRTPSNVSFKTNLADSFGTSMHGGAHVLVDNPNSHSRVSSGPVRSSSSGTYAPAKPLSKAPQIGSHHGLDAVSPARLRNSENPELLFRFEGILRNPHRTKKKWQKQQHQQQQLLAQS